MYIIGEFSKIIYVNRTTLRNWGNYIIISNIIYSRLKKYIKLNKYKIILEFSKIESFEI